MEKYFHSVRLLPDRCKGCVNCIKRCPTEAIRIRQGKAKIIESRCIDCGECIRSCANHAKSAVTDALDDLTQFPYNIALPAPTLYAQFGTEVAVKSVLAGFKLLGFDSVFEVAHGAELVSESIRQYLMRPTYCRPAISSACPAVVRLVQVKFPELIDHLVPVAAPFEVAAQLARGLAAERTGRAEAEIGVWFITPCPAKMTAVRQPLDRSLSHVSGAIAIAKIYGYLLKVLTDADGELDYDLAGSLGVGWAVAGGEASALTGIQPLVVNGIHQVNDVLEQVALGRLQHVDYIEALACDGGCIGGPLTVENRFVAAERLDYRLRSACCSSTGTTHNWRDYPGLAIADQLLAIEPQPGLCMDDDIFQAMNKVEMMDAMLARLPGLDCGSCGSPSCKALAEDIAQGLAVETDCVFNLREKVRDLAQKMVDLAKKLPPPLNR